MPNPIIIAGGGLAGMAAALGLREAGHDVRIYERGRASFQLGGLINLWTPAVKALRSMGVDVTDIGLADHATFWSAKNRQRVDVKFDEVAVREWGGYFFGMLRPELYARIREALPSDIMVTDRGITSFEDLGDEVEVRLSDGSSVRTPLLVGADGIHSVVRRQLFGPVDYREHNILYIGGESYDVPEGLDPAQCVVRHSRTVQGSWAGIRTGGRVGIGWYFVEPWTAGTPVPTGSELLEHARRLAAQFPPEQRHLVDTTAGEITTWQIRDLGEPLKQWSRGRVVIVGDAAHATSPYAAYGAGMSIVDGYFLGQTLDHVDLRSAARIDEALQTFASHRVAHTTEQVQQAHMLGQLFHHSSAFMRPIRDLILDRTPFLQRQVGDKSPASIAAQVEQMGASIHEPAPDRVPA